MDEIEPSERYFKDLPEDREFTVPDLGKRNILPQGKQRNDLFSIKLIASVRLFYKSNSFPRFSPVLLARRKSL